VGRGLMLLFLGIFGLQTMAQPPAVKQLDQALWRGFLTIEVNGPLYTQYLANKLNENGRIIGFVKEKGEFKTSFLLDVQFLINALGEYEFTAAETFSGDYFVSREFRHAFKEEVVDKRMKYNRKVQVSNSKRTNIDFDREASFDKENFPYGTLRVLPSGRLDKKGSLHMSGEFKIPYQALGAILETNERQPPPIGEESGTSRTRTEITKNFVLPLSFDVTITLDRAPVEGAINITADIQNPFPTTEGDASNSSHYRNNLSLTGTYRMIPLFDKKKRGKKEKKKKRRG